MWLFVYRMFLQHASRLYWPLVVEATPAVLGAELGQNPNSGCSCFTPGSLARLVFYSCITWIRFHEFRTNQLRDDQRCYFGRVCSWCRRGVTSSRVKKSVLSCPCFLFSVHDLISVWQWQPGQRLDKAVTLCLSSIRTKTKNWGKNW